MPIQYCPNCKEHEYQDKKYGLKMRICNETKPGKLRCTVCGTILENKAKINPVIITKED